MQLQCAVPNCCNSTVYNEPINNKSIEFYKFPYDDDDLFNKWLAFCEGSKELSSEYQNALICSDHFNKDDYEYRYFSEV